MFLGTICKCKLKQQKRASLGEPLHRVYNFKFMSKFEPFMEVVMNKFGVSEASRFSSNIMSMYFRSVVILCMRVFKFVSIGCNVGVCVPRI